MSELPTGSRRDNLSLIVAMSENNVIGRDGDMPWRISADLKRFKTLTMGHHIIMGRKTFESIGRCLPGRTTIVVTRQPNYSIAESSEKFAIVPSVKTAIESSQNDSEAFIVGGAQIYAATLPMVSTIYLTRVHTFIDNGDTFFPDVAWDHWGLTSRIEKTSDDRNEFDFSFEDYHFQQN